jgi:DNA repair protein RecO (recombination protein O)
MPARDAEAIVLRQYPLAEADCIVVLLTREYGTLRGVAHGLKRPRSRLGAALEPLTHVRLQVYAKEGSELCHVRQCEMIHSYLGKEPTLDRVAAYSYLAELSQEMVPDNHPNAHLFRLFLAVLDAAEKAGATPALVRYFEFWALKLNGWLPNYDYCSVCGGCVKEDGFFARPEAGEGRCRACSEQQGVRIGPAAGRMLRELLALSPAQFSEIARPAGTGRDLERLTQKLLEWHLEKRLKSYPLLKEVLGTG